MPNISSSLASQLVSTNTGNGNSNIIKILNSTGLSGIPRAAFMSMLQRPERAKCYVTSLDNSESFQLAMTPEEIDVRTSTSFRTYHIVNSGEIKLPKGETLTAVAWKGTLLGERNKNYSFIDKDAWEAPSEIINRWNRWRNEEKKLKILITQTTINMEVYLKNFEYSFEGGFGNVKYKVDFVKAKSLFVRAVGDAESTATPDSLNERTPMTKANSTVLKSGETLWSIAQATFGQGSQWTKLADINGVADPTSIAVGTVLHLG